MITYLIHINTNIHQLRNLRKKYFNLIFVVMVVEDLNYNKYIPYITFFIFKKIPKAT